MTLRQLELFLALVKTPHLGKVAAQVGVSQSAISMAIKALEEILETRLFDRINKKIILNEHGRLFFKKVEPLVMGLKECERVFKEERILGEIVIGVSSSIANYIMPQILYSFMEKHAGVSFKMETGNTLEVAALIEMGRVDMGFIEGEYNSVDVVREELATDELYVVTGDRELASKSPCPIEELLDKHRHGLFQHVAHGLLYVRLKERDKGGAKLRTL